MEKRRLSKYRKEQQAQPSGTVTRITKGASLDGLSTEAQTKLTAQRGPWLVVPQVNREVDSNPTSDKVCDSVTLSGANALRLGPDLKS
ncbi:hypothetical protein D623_10028024 [Myotis brandtii]|uniref:Uncharacterized protein n=1 Tax=Myotis brandtii TaxID=109478 RepID=S7N756_MYOBR|nr:hypothetical protein D623_10028024 [Myotis brandtii]